MLRTRTLFAIVAAIVILAAGCAGRDRGAAVRDDEAKAEAPFPTDSPTLLQGGEWSVEELGGAAITDASRVTLNFATDGSVSGNASCNSYRARYELTGDQLAFSEIVTTKKACPPGLMLQEEAFLDAMRNVLRLAVRADGRLVIHLVDGGKVVVRRE